METCPFPFADVPASDTSEYPIRSRESDGQRLLLAAQYGDRVLVSITSDLSNWDTYEIELTEPDGLPHGVRAYTSAEHLVIGPDGWLLQTTTHLGVDFQVLAPTDIRESARYIRFGEPESQGLIVYWETEQQAPDEPNHSRFVTWEELGIDEDTYLHYGVAEYANKPYMPSRLISGAVWAANWGGAPTRTELPSVSQAAWWNVVGTDAGYIALPRLGEPGYPPLVGRVHEMFFSPDGLTWNAVRAPWVEGVSLGTLAAVANGVLVEGGVSEESYYEPVRSQLWLGDATGSDWRSVALPGLPERSWIKLWEAGRGAAGASGPTEGDWQAQWILGTVNGVDWLVMEHQAPREVAPGKTLVAINGNVMLVIDREGKTQRFVIP